MAGPNRRSIGRARDIIGLGMFAALCAAVSGIGAVVTATSVDSWYQTLQKPAFNPPDWLFPPVWTALYVLLAIAGWRIWRRARMAVARPALGIFVVQLGLNLAWSVLFFGTRSIGLALVEIVILLLAIIANTILFWRLDRVAGALLLPYLIWVAFAAVLNIALWRLN